MAADFTFKGCGPFPIAVNPGIPLTFGALLTANEEWPFPGAPVPLSIGQIPSGFCLRVTGEPTPYLTPGACYLCSFTVSCFTGQAPGTYQIVLVAKALALTRRLVLQVRV